MRDLAGRDAGMSMLAPLPAGVNQAHAHPLGLRTAGPTFERGNLAGGLRRGAETARAGASHRGEGPLVQAIKKSIRFSDILKAPLE